VGESDRDGRHGRLVGESDPGTDGSGAWLVGVEYRVILI
jgi:hypothetical protein